MDIFFAKMDGLTAEEIDAFLRNPCVEDSELFIASWVSFSFAGAHSSLAPILVPRDRSGPSITLEVEPGYVFKSLLIIFFFMVSHLCRDL